MKCTCCSNEIEPGKLYCEKCGTEVQIVPTYNPLEDDDFNPLAAGQTKSETPESEPEAEFAEETASQETGTSKGHFDFKWLIFVAVILVLFIFGVSITLSQRNKRINSYEYKYNLAMDAYNAQDYRLAISRLGELERMDESVPFITYISGVCYYNLENYEDALQSFSDYLMLDNTSMSGYEYLIDTYKQLGTPEKIDELWEKDFLDKEILSQYVLEAPEITSGGGTFSEDYILSMKNEHNHAMYYTLDGSDPMSNGTKYLKPVKLEEGNYQIRVVCLTDKVLYNHESSVSVTVAYQPPKVPTIEPAGGDITTETTITMNSEDKDVSIYYSFDGSDPLTGGELYDGPFTILEPCSFVIKIMAVDKRGLSSKVMTYRFTVTE